MPRSSTLAPPPLFHPAISHGSQQTLAESMLPLNFHKIAVLLLLALTSSVCVIAGHAAARADDTEPTPAALRITNHATATYSDDEGRSLMRFRRQLPARCWPLAIIVTRTKRLPRRSSLPTSARSDFSRCNSGNSPDTYTVTRAAERARRIISLPST